MRLRFGVALATVIATIASLVFTALPASAISYASVTASDSMATRTDITGDSQLGAPAQSNSQDYWANNAHDGIFEFGTNPTNDMQMVIRSFSNGVLDTNFNSTGSATVVMQIPAGDRMSSELTTYANGTKWMLLEMNSFTSSGLNYLHYGSYAGGYTGTYTLPTGSATTNYCASRPTSGTNYSNRLGQLELLKDAAFAAPTLLLRCYMTNSDVAGTGAQYYDYLVQLTGGTTLGTSGTWSTKSGLMSPTIDTTDKSFVRMGISVNPAASADSDIAVTSVFLKLSTPLSRYTNNPPHYSEAGDVNAWTKMVIYRTTVGGTTTTSGPIAYTPLTVGTRSGTLIVPPRNDGSVYLYQHSTDFSTQLGKVLKLSSSATGGIATTTTVTGSGPREPVLIASDKTPGSLLKLYVNNGSDRKYWEINASTGALTVGGTFSGSVPNYESLFWAPTADSAGISHYGRTGSTTLTRMSLTTTPPTPTAPSTPTAPTGTAGAGQVSLSWSAPNANNSAITDYEIDYSSNSGSSWDTFADGTSTATTATVTGLTNGTAYTFRIRAVNGVGTSASSSASTSITPIAVPGASTNVVGTFGNTEVALSWTAPTTNNGSTITNYAIQYSSDSGANWTTVTRTASTLTTATVTGLTNGTSYTFRVAAINNVGTGSYSSVSSAVVPATLASTPSAPTVQAGDTAVALSWTAPAANGCAITNYAVQYSSDNGSTWTTFAHTASAATTLTVTGLVNATAYKFQIAATNCAGTTGYSSASAAATPNPVPSQTAGLTVSTNGQSNQLVLSWSAPSNNGSAITDYLIEYSTDGGQTWQTYTDGTSTSTSATLTGLTNGANYSFRVSAVSAIGTGLASSSSASIPAVALPGAIASAPTAVASPGQITLTWSAPASTGGAAISDYTIEYSTDGGQTWQTYSDAVSASTTATLTGLSTGASYTFKISATNSLGSGNASTVSTAAIALAATAPDAITQTTATAGSNPGEVVLSWSAPAANGSAITDYVIEYSLDGGVTWLTFTDGTSTATTATITGLTAGTSYVFRVTAVNGVGTATAGTASAAQSPATAAPVVNTPPAEATPVNSVNPRLIPGEVTFAAQRSIPAGGTVSIRGTNLDMIVAVLVSNRTAPITLQTQTLLEFQAPKQVIGYADLTLVYALGSIHFPNAIEIAATGPVKIALTKFWKHKISQRSAAVLIKAWPSTVGASEVTCVARYATAKDRPLAMWRAKRTCASLQASRKGVKYSVAVSRTKSMPQVELRIKY